ncbi:hypothetical protein [Streptomyces anandii]|uniref:hypothetical protein n=1 Tax=Streptomyces anandii TaxID=285454 RepID=UPI0016749995|nr:hypothetical protein [Streptomyces anandii]
MSEPLPSKYAGAPIFSPLLRRIRATAGPGKINATDPWSSMGGFRLEATDGPPRPDPVRLLGDGPTGLGWEVDHKTCACLCDHIRGGCNIDFRDPATGYFVYYSNGMWAAPTTSGTAASWPTPTGTPSPADGAPALDGGVAPVGGADGLYQGVVPCRWILTVRHRILMDVSLCHRSLITAGQRLSASKVR